MSGILKGYFRNNPFHNQELMVFGREKSTYNALIFTKNSPLAPVFDLGMKMMRETGTVEQVKDNTVTDQ